METVRAVSQERRESMPWTRDGGTENGRGTTPSLDELETAIERLGQRIASRWAEQNNLRRSAQGLSFVERGLRFHLMRRVAVEGSTEEIRLAGAALDAMKEQLDRALDGPASSEIDEQRDHLKHALFRAMDALVLLRVQHRLPGVR